MKRQRAARVGDPRPGSTISPHGTQRVGAFATLPALIEQLGGDAAAILWSAGLAPDALDDPEHRIPYGALGRVLNESVERTGCAHFGLLVGRMWHLSDLGIVGEIMRNSPTVGEALNRLTFYQRLNSDSAVPFVRAAAGVVDLGCAIYESGSLAVGQLCDAYLAAGFNFMRELCGTEWAPSEVFLPHARPRDSTHHRHFFKVQPHFDAEFCALRFPEYWVHKVILDADPDRLRAAEQRAQAPRRPSLVNEVSRSLRILLLSGNSSGDDVASMLSMNRRTLNRRLMQQGMTFQSVLDETRFEMARQMLTHSDVSLDNIAATLGYAGVSCFMRSFRRWSDMTPSAWRRKFGIRDSNDRALPVPGPSRPIPATSGSLSRARTTDRTAVT